MSLNEYKERQKQLRAFTQDGWVEERDARWKKLPDELRADWFVMHGRDPAGGKIDDDKSPDWERQQALEWELAEKLDAMDPTARARVFATAFPRLAVFVGDAWELQKRLPYQVAYTRRGLRAPQWPEATAGSRGDWLRELAELVDPYDQDITWFAAWAAHLSPHDDGDVLGIVLAAALNRRDAAGDEVFAILKATVEGTHPTAQMGRYVARALLVCDRPEAWELVERLLLAAQRQEGVRQMILETVDEAHPEAFRRMLRLILDENLVRFSSVVRAFDVWLGLRWDSASAGVVKRGIERLHTFLTDQAAREAAVRGTDPEDVYLALFAIGIDDIAGIEPKVEPLLASPKVELRFATAWVLLATGWVAYFELVAHLYDDPDPRMRNLAAVALSAEELSREFKDTDHFARLTSIYASFSKPQISVKPLVWPWQVDTIQRSLVADAMIASRGAHPWSDVVPFASSMSPQGRSRLVECIAAEKKPDRIVRSALLQLTGDSSPGVREAALDALAKLTPTEEEILYLEGLLTRQAGNLRRGILHLLVNQSDAAALSSARRLLGGKNQRLRLAGLEILRLLKSAGRVLPQVREIATATASEEERSAEEAKQLALALDEAPEVPTQENGFGLYDPTTCTPGPAPRDPGLVLVTDACIEQILSLDELIHTHREQPVVIMRWRGSAKEEVLLGACTYFPEPSPGRPVEDEIDRLPLREVWNRWWSEWAAKLGSRARLELFRAAAVFENSSAARYYFEPEEEKLEGFGWPEFESEKHFVRRAAQIRYGAVIKVIIEWLVQLHAVENAHEFYLDGAATFLALAAAKKPDAETMVTLFGERFGSDRHPAQQFLRAAESHFSRHAKFWTDEQRLRLWQMHQWLNRPTGVTPAPHIRPSLRVLLESFRLGAANEADVYDHLIGPRQTSGSRLYYGPSGYWDLGDVTRQRAVQEYANQPALLAIADRVRSRIIEIEINRGETETPATELVVQVRSVPGAATFARVLAASARCSLQRGYSRGGSSRKEALSHLLRICVPTAEDTPAAVAPMLREIGLKDERLIEAVMYAPQWSAHVEAALQWKGLESSIWWFHAHTKDSQWSVEQEIRDQWKSVIAERTALSADVLTQGAVDVAWFQVAFGALGAARWSVLDEAARYASSGTGHARAQLFARTMRGEVTEAELLKRIREKRHQDSVRALGLLPLSVGPRREEEILRRYLALQDFVRTARQFGSQRQASEKLAARLGQENLARTAGYSDPLRLQWAMEVRAARDLQDGSLQAHAGEVTVTLAVDPLGEISLEASKNGRVLKAIPPAVRKHAKVKELIDRKTSLSRQRGSMRRSLEEMMCRGDALSGAELKLLMSHPIAAPILSQLVWLNDGVLGYPREGGRVLTDWRGKSEPVLDKETLRIAHPHDLWKSKQWTEWQRDCFARECVQPFKQIFREYYPLTAEERKNPEHTRRFAGQQVNPQQALALLGSRGWVTRPEEGVGRTFHREDLTAWLTFEEGFHTPAEVEGLTLGGVVFTKRTKPDVVPVDQVDPALFSEVMRDVDLVASVAHRGGVDPEATASTVEMRTALVRETARVLQLDNVRIKDRHAIIEGQHATYTVHLGSGVAHLLPGGMLFIVAVHAQHRGRLFLPFADDDPKTAETLSKILLLARDGEIRDPAILEQIRAAPRVQTH